MIVYFVIVWGWVLKIVVYVFWLVFLFIFGWFGFGGDFCNVILQILLLVFGVVIYLFFLIVYECLLIKCSNEMIINIFVFELEIMLQEDNDIYWLDGKIIILVCNEGMLIFLMVSKM